MKEYNRIDRVCFGGVCTASRGKYFVNKSAPSGMGGVCLGGMRLGLGGLANCSNNICSGHPYHNRNFVCGGMCKICMRGTESMRVSSLEIRIKPGMGCKKGAFKVSSWRGGLFVGLGRRSWANMLE